MILSIKDFSFFSPCSQRKKYIINTPPPQTELEALRRALRLKRHFRNEENEFNIDQYKPKSTFNIRYKDTAIEVYMNSLVENIMKIEITKDNYDNFTSKE